MVKSVSLHNAKRNAHIYFDTIWMSTGNRSEAYAWLGFVLKRRPRDCHMSNMNLRQTLEVIRLCRPIARQLWKDNPKLQPHIRWRYKW